MQTVNIICLGRLKENYLKDACKEYEKRLKGYCTLKINELEPVTLPGDPSEKQIENALEKEAEMIEKKLPANALTFAMCIEGKQLKRKAVGKDGRCGSSGQICDMFYHRKLVWPCTTYKSTCGYKTVNVRNDISAPAGKSDAA